MVRAIRHAFALCSRLHVNALVLHSAAPAVLTSIGCALHRHTGLPNTNGENRENLIFTYGGVAPNAIESGEAKWPTGFYGGPAVEQGGKMFNKNFLECAKEIDAQGRLNTPLRRQLLGIELTHPEAPATLS